MPTDPERREPDDVDSEFERIVAGLDLDTTALDTTAPGDPAGSVSDNQDTDQLPATSGPLFDPRLSDPLPADEDDTDGYVEHFEPPEPPAQRIRPLTWLGWLGAAGTPVLMLLVAIFGWYIPGELAAVLVAAFVAGVVYLIMSASRPDDEQGWDDGAVL